MRAGEEAILALSGDRAEALEFFDEIAARGIRAALSLERFSEVGQPAVQLQIKVWCAEDDLLWVAQAARARQYPVDAEDRALLINIL